ncbi:condensation domain-containing protein [Streptomyces sp. NPDC058701]|uniref:condensation domain-containing protein n=1 Tax=Streptomyces sp. NPDC058701 TaxID=3346608 RepID=UPI003648AAEC
MVHEVLPGAPAGVLTLELSGLPDDAHAERFAAWIAGRHRRTHLVLEGRGPGRHTLRLLPGTPTPPTPDTPVTPNPPATAPAQPAPAPLRPGLLADLLGPGPAAGDPVALTGYQRELLLDCAARPPGRGGELEQVYWNWSGPLDRDRFRAAWQSLSARESVLRAAFDWTALPRLVLHPRATVDITHHHTRTATAWQDLLEADRRRGLDPARPPLLRLSVLEGHPAQPARILLTCHRALLDEHAVHLLLREFYRAYLAGGRLPGGERRPDLRDHARWLARQDSTGARELWTRTAPPARPATAAGRPGPGTGQSGAGRLRRRLGAPHSSRLRSWAADRGAGESSALHAAWALLLYRAAARTGPLRVTFAVRLHGRDTALPGAAGLPGPPAGPLPLTVRVDPAAPLGELLHQVRDALLDLAAYPWVSADLIRAWTGRPGPAAPLAESAVSFTAPAELPPAVSADLAARGVTAGPPRTAGTATALPVTVGARHENDGALLLDAVYDRARLTDADASALLAQCTALLRDLPGLTGPHCTVGRALDLLAGTDPPAMAPRPPAPRPPAPDTLRPGEPSAGVLCLLAAPGVTPGAYALFARRHRGPERIVVLECQGPPYTAVPAALAALRGPGGRLVLGGCGPGAGAAYALARLLADAGGAAVGVVMTGLAGPGESADALARGLAALPARRP